VDSRFRGNDCAPNDTTTSQGLSLTLDTIRRHLEGEITIGLYSINPATQCSKWMAIDADYTDSLTDLLKLSFYFRQDRVESALEKSHQGGVLVSSGMGVHSLQRPCLANDTIT
jgi:hypothetical protein